MSNKNTDVVLILRDGKELPVIYPKRIGRENDGLNSGRYWYNIDVNDRTWSKDNPRFIIGNPGSPYKSWDGVDYIINADAIFGIKRLPIDLQEKANLIYAREEQEAREKEHRYRQIQGSEFDALEARVKALETRLQ